MRQILSGLVAGIALLGLAACGDTEDTTTQGIDQNGTTQEAPPADGGAGGDLGGGGADTGGGTTAPAQ